MNKGTTIIDLGMIDFAAAFAVQERLVAAIAAGHAEETLLLLEHTPVYTIGSGGNMLNLLDSRAEVRRINRGGDVTWHGPGQLVGYPLLDLAGRGRDLHRCLRFQEELIIAVAAEFGVAGGRVAGRTGVWTARGKLASIGVGVRHWVTMHGFALNVAADLSGFEAINPCGIKGCPMTSLEREAGAAVLLEEVKMSVADRFAAVLEKELPIVAERRCL